MRPFRTLRKFTSHESGLTFIETVVALAILGVISVAFLSGLTNAYKSVFIADEQTTAESLAQSQMEWGKTVPYVIGTTEYTPAPLPGGGDYVNYSVNITAEPLHDPDEGLQKITVTIQHFDKEIVELEGYKGQR
ncbi:prepilin-type N-terminal cleavage/methylation domain-containing protein [Chloroflexota bacterium]